jgi:hypothetical protein
MQIRKAGKRSLKRAFFFVVAALVASYPDEAATALALKVGSQVAGIHIVATDKLPTNLHRAPVDEYCVDYRIDHPKSAGGRLAAKNGWIVTSETKLGTYDAVTFVGRLDAGTSAVCYPANGNLAIFDGPHLVAIAYSHSRSEKVLGIAEQVTDRRIRLNTNTPTPPFADAVLRHGVFIEDTAPTDPVCGATAVVPNIYDQDIRRARRKLIAAGWQPVRPSEKLLGGMDEQLKRQGVVEVESCAGTGWSPCAFNYRHNRGFRLRVVSAGEDRAIVISYDVDCNDTSERKRTL